MVQKFDCSVSFGGVSATSWVLFKFLNCGPLIELSQSRMQTPQPCKCAVTRSSAVTDAFTGPVVLGASGSCCCGVHVVAVIDLGDSLELRASGSFASVVMNVPQLPARLECCQQATRQMQSHPPRESFPAACPLLQAINS